MNKLKTGLALAIILLALTTPVYAQSDTYAIVIDVDAPTTVKPGETVTVTITTEYNLPETTYCIVGIYDPVDYTTIQEYEFTDQGYVESAFELDIIAPDTEGTYELAADIFYMSEGGLVYTEGSEQLFTITVEQASTGIPGFPLAATLIGLAAILHRKKTA
jgi:hypothetical protein